MWWSCLESNSNQKCWSLILAAYMSNPPPRTAAWECQQHLGKVSNRGEAHCQDPRQWSAESERRQAQQKRHKLTRSVSPMRILIRCSELWCGLVACVMESWNSLMTSSVQRQLNLSLALQDSNHVYLPYLKAKHALFVVTRLWKPWQPLSTFSCLLWKRNRSK